MFMLGFVLLVNIITLRIIARRLSDNPPDRYYYLSGVAACMAVGLLLAAIAWPLSGQIAPFWGGGLLLLALANGGGAIHWRRRYVRT